MCVIINSLLAIINWHQNPECKPQGLKIPTPLLTGLFVPNMTIKPPSEWVTPCYQCLLSLILHWPSLIPELVSEPWVQTSGSGISHPLVNCIICAQSHHYTSFWVGNALLSVLVILNSILASINSRITICTTSTNLMVWIFLHPCQWDYLCPTLPLHYLLRG